MIKRIVWFLFIVSFCTPIYAQDGYKISIEVNGAKGNTLLFSLYTGTYSRTVILDSVRITGDKQVANFSSKLKKRGAIYKLCFKGQEKSNLINIVVDNGASLNLVVPSSNLNTITSKSLLNADFFEYQRKVVSRIDKETKLKELQKKYPNSVLSLFSQLELRKMAPLDSNRNAYTKYLAGINLNDKRLSLLPNAYSFLLEYINSNTVNAGNYSYAVDVLLKGMTCESINYFFYLDWFFLNMKYYQRYKLEDTYKSVYQKYLNTAACKSKKDKLYNEITAEIKKLDDLEIGTNFPDFKMEDSTGVALEIAKIYPNSKYTFALFYDPDCEQCEKIVPEVANFFKNLESKGLVLQKIAFNITEDAAKWKKFIKTANISDWINVKSYKGENKFQLDLKVFSTPSYFLLDKNGVILLKTYNTKEIEVLLRSGN